MSSWHQLAATMHDISKYYQGSCAAVRLDGQYELVVRPRPLRRKVYLLYFPCQELNEHVRLGGHIGAEFIIFR